MADARTAAPPLLLGDDETADPHSNREGGWSRLIREPTSVFFLTLFLLLGGIAVSAPLLGLPDPAHQFIGDELFPPNAQYWFGTDDFGRDQVSRVVWGMRLSLSIGLLAALAAGTFGIFFGLVQGYYGGWVDDVIGRLWDTLLAFPGLLLGLAVGIILGEGVHIAAIASCLINMPLISRITRSGVMVEMEREYTLAARALGSSTLRVMFRHMLPNIFPVAMVQVTLTVAHAMILEAGLSFLGIGAQPPQPSLGNMLRDAQSFMSYGVWLSIFPGIALSLLLLLVSYISDALADAFDPRRQIAKE